MLVWVDIETTGIDPDYHDILELAVVVTDDDLVIVGQASWVIHYPVEKRDWARKASFLDDCVDEWHQKSGLWQECEHSGLTIRDVYHEAIEFLENMGVEPGTTPMAGSSIGSLDRPFIRYQMKRLDEYLHYRNVDVSSIKELAARWYPCLATPEKPRAHRALEDCLESIEFLKFFRREVFR